jgi:hypothetical protein
MNDASTPAPPVAPARLRRLRALRHLCTLIGGLLLVFGLGIKDSGDPLVLLVGVALLIAAYACLRRERRLASAAPPPQG